MEWKVDLDQSGKFVRARQWDDFDLDDQADFLSATFSGDHWRPGLGILFDYRGLKIATLSEGDLAAVKVIFQSVRNRISSSKIALLCDDPALFEVGRHFGELLAPKLENEVFIFQNEEIATNWLKA
jgi:hypothetical protein